MGDVSAVFEEVSSGGLTVAELSQRCGMSATRVEEVTGFLEECGVVRIAGSKVLLSDEIASLSEG